MESNHIEWPSKGSILATPERKRYRSSVSFADSGLGSPFFGSPPSKLIGLSSASSVMKTPTQKRSPINATDMYSSQLSTFLHVSAFSESFGSPDNCSSFSSLRLSDPNKAFEYRFSGTSVPEHSQPINMTSNVFEAGRPSTSSYNMLQQKSLRSMCRSATKISPMKRDFISEKEHFNVNMMMSYCEAETPSKGFKNAISVGENSFDYEGFSMVTSTPIRCGQINENPTDCHRPIAVHYMMPEQANGPLESSLCESIEVYEQHSQLVSVMKSGSFVSEEISPPKSACHVRISAKELSYKGKENFVSQNLNKLKPLSNSVTSHQYCSRGKSQTKSFKVPNKSLRVNSRKWIQIVCGETPHQMELTKSAQLFIQALQTQL